MKGERSTEEPTAGDTPGEFESLGRLSLDGDPVAVDTDDDVIAVAVADADGDDDTVTVAESSLGPDDAVEVGPLPLQDVAVDGRAFALSPGSLWAIRPDGYFEERSVEDAVAVESVVPGERLAVVDRSGRVSWFDPRRLRERDSTELSLPGPTSLAAGGNGLLAVASGSHLAIVDARDGLAVTRTEFSTRVRGVAVLGDGAVVATERFTLGLATDCDRRWRTAEPLDRLATRGGSFVHGETDESLFRVGASSGVSAIGDALPATHLSQSSDGGRLAAVTDGADGHVLRWYDCDLSVADPDGDEGADPIEATVRTDRLAAGEAGTVRIALENPGSTERSVDVRIAVQDASIGGKETREPPQLVAVPPGEVATAPFDGVRPHADAERCLVELFDNESGEQLARDELPVVRDADPISLGTTRGGLTDEGVNWTATVENTAPTARSCVLRLESGDWASEPIDLDPGEATTVRFETDPETLPTTLRAAAAPEEAEPRAHDSSALVEQPLEAPPEPFSMDARLAADDAVLEVDVTARIPVDGTLDLRSGAFGEGTLTPTPRSVRLDAEDSVLTWIPFDEPPTGEFDVTVDLCGVERSATLENVEELSVDHRVVLLDEDLPIGGRRVEGLRVTNRGDEPVSGEPVAANAPDADLEPASLPSFPPGETTMTRTSAGFAGSGARLDEASVGLATARVGDTAVPEGWPPLIVQPSVVDGRDAVARAHIVNRGAAAVEVGSVSFDGIELLESDRTVEPDTAVGVRERLPDGGPDGDAVPVDLSVRTSGGESTCRTLAPVFTPRPVAKLVTVATTKAQSDELTVTVENGADVPIRSITLVREEDGTEEIVDRGRALPAGERWEGTLPTRTPYVEQREEFSLYVTIGHLAYCAKFVSSRQSAWTAMREVDWEVGGPQSFPVDVRSRWSE